MNTKDCLWENPLSCLLADFGGALSPGNENGGEHSSSSFVALSVTIGLPHQQYRASVPV